MCQALWRRCSAPDMFHPDIAKNVTRPVKVSVQPDCFYVFVPAGNQATAVVKTYANLGMAAEGSRLIGPGDVTQDTKLRGVGDAAVGLTAMHHYSAD